MRVVHELEKVGYQKNSVITVGTYDGVHRGHRVIIEEAVHRAKRKQGRSVVVTFDPHPRQVLIKNGGSISLLSTLTEREKLCAALGVDVFFIINFTYEFSRLTFGEFYKHYLIDGIGVSEVIEGYDHHFGRDREGSIEQLLQLGKEYSFGVHAIEPICFEGELVSSSRIRIHLLEGRVDRAAQLLGRPYSFSGMVVRGDRRGKSLGYPTANLRLIEADMLVPQNGIYFVEVSIDNRTYYGMASIGVRPTFGENGERTIEVYIFEYDKEIYGSLLELRFLRRLRDELKFESVDALIRQMNLDAQESLKIMSKLSKEHLHTKV